MSFRPLLLIPAERATGRGDPECRTPRSMSPLPNPAGTGSRPDPLDDSDPSSWKPSAPGLAHAAFSNSPGRFMVSLIPVKLAAFRKSGERRHRQALVGTRHRGRGLRKDSYRTFAARSLPNRKRPILTVQSPRTHPDRPCGLRRIDGPAALHPDEGRSGRGRGGSGQPLSYLCCEKRDRSIERLAASVGREQQLIFMPQRRLVILGKEQRVHRDVFSAQGIGERLDSSAALQPPVAFP